MMRLRAIIAAPREHAAFKHLEDVTGGYSRTAESLADEGKYRSAINTYNDGIRELDRLADEDWGLAATRMGKWIKDYKQTFAGRSESLQRIMDAYEAEGARDKAESVQQLRELIRSGFHRLCLGHDVSEELKPGIGKFIGVGSAVDIKGNYITSLSDALRRIIRENDIPEEAKLVIVAAAAFAAIRYDEQAADILTKDGKLSLMPIEYFVKNGGVCRNHADLTLGLMQALRQSGDITGRFGVAFKRPEYDTSNNQVRRVVEPGHAYVRYIGENGQAWTVDATNLAVELASP